MARRFLHTIKKTGVHIIYRAGDCLDIDPRRFTVSWGAKVRQITYEPQMVFGERQLPINTNEQKNQGCYVEVLQALYDQMSAALILNKRLLVVRVDIRQYSYTADSEQITRLMRKIKRWLSEQYGMQNVGHLWVREQEKAKGQHYHLTLMLDGRKMKHPKRLLDKIESLAHGWDWPKPFTPKSCFVDVRPNDDLAYSRAFYRSSYLAKTRGKGYGGKLAKNFSASRLKPPS